MSTHLEVVRDRHELEGLRWLRLRLLLGSNRLSDLRWESTGKSIADWSSTVDGTWGTDLRAGAIDSAWGTNLGASAIDGTWSTDLWSGTSAVDGTWGLTVWLRLDDRLRLHNRLGLWSNVGWSLWSVRSWLLSIGSWSWSAIESLRLTIRLRSLWSIR